MLETREETIEIGILHLILSEALLDVTAVMIIYGIESELREEQSLVESELWGLGVMQLGWELLASCMQG